MSTKTPFTVDDLYLHRHILEAQVSPDSAEAACTVRSVDRDDNGYRYAIWCVPLDGGAARQMTSDEIDTSNTPRWSPDGHTLAFISGMSGSMQIHALDRSGSNLRQWGQFDSGASDFRWFPDGQSLLVASGVTVDPELRGARPTRPANTRPSAPEIAWKLPYKSDGTGFLLQREVHLFRLDTATGTSTQVTDGAFDVLGFDISRNGQQIAYTRTRSGRFAHCTELWISQADGSNHRPLVQGLATVASPAWSPDGQWLAFTGAQREGDGQTTLWLFERSSGVCTTFTGEHLEIAANTAPYWSADSQKLFFVEAFRGRHRIVSATVAGRQCTTLVSGDRQFGFLACSEKALVYGVDRLDLPSELWTTPLRTGADVVPAADHDGSEKKLTDFNPWWRERTAIEVEVRSFDVPDGRGGTETIEGWLMQAKGTTGVAPLLNDAHGGPSSYALLDFDSDMHRQVLCSQGWRVLALNAVGSSSFGREFCDRLAGHWGEYDLPQHLAAIDQLGAEGLCDVRVAMSGKSYGGFLTCWAIGHTARFQAAIVMAPVGNIETHYGTSDGGYYSDPRYLGTAPVFDRALARSLSPLQYVERATTPTLYLQGKDDERCPKCQSEELFVSMMRAGTTPTELVLYPGEGHSFLGSGKPDCRDHASHSVLGWLARHVTAPAAQGTAGAPGAPPAAASPEQRRTSGADVSTADVSDPEFEPEEGVSS